MQLPQYHVQQVAGKHIPSKTPVIKPVHCQRSPVNSVWCRAYATNEANAASNRVLLAHVASSQQKADNLLKYHPELEDIDLESWLSFLNAYGIQKHLFVKMLSTNPDLFVRGSLFNAGRAMMFLQSLGLSARDISAHVIPRCGDLLLLDVEARIKPVAAFLRAGHHTGTELQGGSSAATAWGGAGDDSSRSESNTAATPSSASGMTVGRSPAAAGAAGRQTGVGQGSNGLSGSDATPGWSGDVMPQGLGLSPEQLKSLVSRCPKVLTMDVQADIIPRMTFLASLGLTPAQVRHMLCLNSALLAGPYEAPVHRVLGFLTAHCGFTRPAARELLVDCADMVVWSSSALERKWAYLVHHVYGSPATTAALSAAATAPSPPPSPPCTSTPPSASPEAAADDQGHQGAASAAARARAGVRAYPRALSASLLNELGPRYSYARDRGLLHHLLAYDEGVRGVSLSLARMLRHDNPGYVATLQGDEQDFAQYCARWRRTEGATLTVTSAAFGEQSW
uniref:Uncharacterized protein n=1 Tax=Chlamydomonas leiostraca TaxID=1034604 RepID=A0A7S0RGQ5_9CHLO|mmetsp:Transcript_22178/g.56349  ORF Transcript_22178/g.56349 Transcript_22178/m.56349 type:complete len:508 (+) Transcript_22178:101-1624(+)